MAIAQEPRCHVAGYVGLAADTEAEAEAGKAGEGTRGLTFQ